MKLGAARAVAVVVTPSQELPWRLVAVVVAIPSRRPPWPVVGAARGATRLLRASVVGNPIASRRRRRRNPIAAAPRRRRSSRSKFRRSNGRFKRHSRKRHYVKAHTTRKGVHVRRHMRNPLIHGNPIANPITGPVEFISGIFGVGAGFGLASFADRLVTTHALSTTGQDAPAVGQIYNSEALLAPLWANMSTIGWKRLAAAAGSVVVPLAAASAFKSHMGWKVFFQLMGYGALGRTAGKMFDDGIAAAMGTQPLAQRLYGGEVAAAAKLTAATSAALPAAAPATFAGLPMGGAVRQAFPLPVGQFAPPPPPPRQVRAAVPQQHHRPPSPSRATRSPRRRACSSPEPRRPTT